MKVFEFTSTFDESTVILSWEFNRSTAEFCIKIREAFRISEDSGFSLRDETNDIVVLSRNLPSGKYWVTPSGSTVNMQSIVQNREDDRQIDEECDEIFEEKMLRIACADALIANERTWLAWTRTSLSIMTCCFSFVFLDNWSQRPFRTKLLSHMCTILFACSFVGCFVVGYSRFRLFSRLLKEFHTSTDYNSLQIDFYHMHKTWAYFLGFVLLFSSVVYMGVIHHIETLNIIGD